MGFVAILAYYANESGNKTDLSKLTENIGKLEDNMILSTNWGNTERVYFLTKGISQDKITSKVYGMTVPFVDNDTVEGMSLNQPIVVKINE